MPYGKSPITLLAGEDLAAKRLLRLSAGEVFHNTATATYDPIGVNDYAVDDTYYAELSTLSEDGTLEITAAGIISQNADVYAAADGKVQALPATGGTYRKIGIAMEAASADGDIIEVMPYEYTSTVDVDTAATTAAPAITPGKVTTIDSTSNAVNATLAADTVIGRHTVVVMTNASNSSTVTIAAHDVEDGEVYTFDAVDEMLDLEWTGTEYTTVAATATNINTLTAAAPAIVPGTVNYIDSTSNAVDATLAADTMTGRQTTVVMTNASNSSTVTIAAHDVEDGEVYTFDAVDEALILEWTGTEYTTMRATAANINTLTTAAPAIVPGTVNYIDSTSNAVDATLAADTVTGRQTTVVMTNASNSSTVTIAAHDINDGEVYTFGTVDQALILEWTGTEYTTVHATATNDNELTTATPAIVPGTVNTINSGSNAVDATLADDTVIGRHTIIVMTEASNSSTVSIAHHVTSDPEVATFDAVDETLDLIWTGTEYATIYATATFV